MTDQRREENAPAPTSRGFSVLGAIAELKIRCYETRLLAVVVVIAIERVVTLQRVIVAVGPFPWEESPFGPWYAAPILARR